MSKKILNSQTCYYCGREATSSEHVPPKCIFPERKDAFGKDYRINLITVPSCDEHNLKKAKDDEFFMACITAQVGNNGAGYLQTQTKLCRALERTENSLLRATIFDAKAAELELQNGTKFPILVGKADMPRLCRILEHISRGLYLHTTGKRFRGRCVVIPSFVRFVDDPDLEHIKQLSNVLVSQERDSWVSYGENPDIFYYQFGPEDQFGLTPMVMTFYKGAEVYVGFQPDGVKLPHRTLAEATPENPKQIEIHLSDES